MAKQEQHTMSFRVENGVHERFVNATNRLGMNGSHVLRDALLEKVEELEELVIVSERLKKNRQKKPIASLWKDLGLDYNV